MGVQRDMQERGHSLESIKASIDARKPDFDAFVAPQRADADLVIQVLPTELTKDDTGKILKVKFIQAIGKDKFEPSYLFDEEVSVPEMDGEFSNLAELCYIENQLHNTDSKFNGELTQSMVNNKGAPGSNNGSGFFQALAALKLRGLYEKISGKKVESGVAA